MTNKQKKTAEWRKKILGYEDEVRDLSRRIADGEIEIGSDEFNISTQIINTDAGRIDAIRQMIDETL